MAKCFIDDNTLTNIGNAIRSVNGSSDLMLPSAMPDAISLLNNGLYVWKKLTAEGGDFIDFVVSDSETTYPDGAVHTDGYWYELFDLKSFGIDFGEVTLASTASSVTVSHNLGVVPLWVALIPQSVEENANRTLANLNNDELVYYSKNGLKFLSTANTLTETEITFVAQNTTAGFNNTSYYWFAVVQKGAKQCFIKQQITDISQ